MLQDVPLLAEVRAHLNAAKNFDEGYLTRYMLLAESPHELAGVLIAIRIVSGSFGGGDSGWQRNAFTDKAIDLATRLYPGVVENLHRGFEKKVLTKTYNSPRITTNLDNVIQLSDEARKQQAALRDNTGTNYKGERFIRPKARHVSGYYFDRKVGANVNDFKR